jgi:hypothetical protein
MNNKGNYLVLGFVALTIGVLLLGALAIPVSKDLYTILPTSESLTLQLDIAKSTTQNISSFTALLNSSGGTVPASNYTVSTSANTVTLDDAVLYTNNTIGVASYQYFPGNYLGSATDRTLASVIVVALIIGIAFAGFKMFNLV